jgi:hypothetical protein
VNLILTESFLSKLISWGAALTTVFLISGGVTDPVNAPKMLILGMVGLAAFTVCMGTSLRNRIFQHKLIALALTAFTVQMFISSILSKSPFSQNIYGVYGRNNGLLTYLFLVMILCSVLCIQNILFFKHVILAFFIAGLINLVYSLWVILFGDFVGWNNPYGNILGTLGNPNFIGAFLGMLFSALLAKSLDQNLQKWQRLILIILLPLCLFEIFESHAVQGRIVAAFGSIIVLLVFIRAKFSKSILVAFSLTSLLLGIFSIAGALQKGPLTSLIYKNSVSLRGQYWLAGWNTGMANSGTGSGMDAFGDWYRRARDIHALDLPGVNTVVNAAHNVPIDMFAFGGWPLFLIYLSLMIYAGYRGTQILFRFKEFDSTRAALLALWSGYQVQSIISINQIGLAVWGWVLSGALIAYEFTSRNWENNTPPKFKLEKIIMKRKRNPIPAKVLILAFSGSMLGLIIAIPPLISDAAWKKAEFTQSLPLIEKSMHESYFNPQNTQKYVVNIDLLERSQLNSLSRKYALEAVNWNSESFDLWKMLYLIRDSTQIEKSLALSKMKNLDPFNPDVTSVR